ncbi:arsenate reductase family protein [Pseudoalteromonas sp. KG3]|jgi:arsenate reductase|uniref:Arsenate reductase n=1 Tax=Pseudoalteromonas prydzensis TaxID=182141 RepID=A0ABR9FK25_9GAMM|nr:MULTISPECIES: arsenate reductase family protein [Pseudoalteromonas]MBE0457182.1 arsenate reductase family protein [Pseudoalteromonas prydzensis]WKD23009.1 arsenate reductase family protein [Pseudoalteromonas sp. KG3]
MIVIHHNPACGTSRNVLNIIIDAGYQPIIIDYQQQGWTKAQLLALFAAANLTPKTALRVSKSPAKQLGLLAEDVSDETILEAMLAYPILVNRPIVCSSKGVKLCRPSEIVLSLLNNWPPGPYYKEDGQPILDHNGKLISS